MLSSYLCDLKYHMNTKKNVMLGRYLFLTVQTVVTRCPDASSYLERTDRAWAPASGTFFLLVSFLKNRNMKWMNSVRSEESECLRLINSLFEGLMKWSNSLKGAYLPPKRKCCPRIKAIKFS